MKAVAYTRPDPWRLTPLPTDTDRGVAPELVALVRALAERQAEIDYEAARGGRAPQPSLP